MAPQKFSIERSITIAAPPARVYELIADFHQWTRWSPWEKLDADLERGYSGPHGEVGAGYTWKGNRKAGQGNMTFTELVPPSSVSVDVTFLRPFKASNKVVFTITPDGTTGGSVVRWLMTGENTGLGKVFAKVMPVDRLVGGDFEKGLTAMKAAAEGV
jgi:uncharacterized protein YndB with AHSA1/START domain